MGLRHQIDNRRKRLSTLRDGAIGQPQLNPLKSKPKSGKGMTELHRAVISADHKRLEELLQQHSPSTRQPSILTTSGRVVSLDINEHDEFGRTALHWAVALKDLESVKTLLHDPRSKCQLRDKDGRTPLHDAAIHGWYEGISTLLPKYEVDDTSPELPGIGIKDKGGRTALHWSTEYGHLRIVEELANKDAWKATDRDGNTALHRAAQRGHKEIVEILLKKLADNEEPKNDSQKTPFQVAAENEQEEIAWLYFQEPKLQPQHESIALSLVQHYRNLNKKNKLFFWATKAGYTNVVQALLEIGAEFDAKDEYMWTPLSYAAENGQEAIVQLLLEKGADFNAKAGFERIPLWYAATNEHAAVVQLLLEKGADFEYNHSNQTRLSYAAENGFAAAVQILLDKGANVNAQESHYGNALQAASYEGHEEVVKILLDKGANINALGGFYGNALEAARRGCRHRHNKKFDKMGCHDQVEHILLQKMADVKAQEENGNALQAASSEGHDEAVQESI